MCGENALVYNENISANVYIGNNKIIMEILVQLVKSFALSLKMFSLGFFGGSWGNQLGWGLVVPDSIDDKMRYLVYISKGVFGIMSYFGIS